MEKKFNVIIRFSPPYGDGTMKKKIVKKYAQFSPPYGDGTIMKNISVSKSLFSPPCGDGTLNISQNIVKWKS